MISNDTDFWTDERFRLAAYLGTAALFIIVMLLRFGEDPEPPPLPARPAAPTPSSLASLDYSPNLYRAGLEKDSLDLGLAITTPEQLTAPLIYESVEPHLVLEPGGAPFQTRALSISARIGVVAPEYPPGAVGADHIVLRIENRTGEPLAYRVDTDVNAAPALCNGKNDLPHDAIALAAHEIIERTECVARPGLSLTLSSVETVTLPRLSYFYVSRLFPGYIGLDARATRGHRPPAGDICPHVPEQAIRRGLEKHDVSWRDVIDFYARHACERYIFPVGYHAFTRSGRYSLPVSPAQVAAVQGTP